MLRLSGAWSCAGRFKSVSVTGNRRQLGTSRNSSDVRRIPSVVAWSFEMRTEGIHAKGKGENLSHSSGVRRKTPRLVARSFDWFLVPEGSQINGGITTGDQMKVPRAVT